MISNSNMWICATLLVLLNLRLTAAQTGDCDTYIEYTDQGPIGGKRHRITTSPGLDECLGYCESTDTCLSFHYGEEGRRKRCWILSIARTAYKRRPLDAARGYTNYEFPCRLDDQGTPYVVTANMDLSTGSLTAVSGVTQLDKCHAACIADSTCGIWKWEKDNSAPCSYYTGLPSSGGITLQASSGVFLFDIRSEEAVVCDSGSGYSQLNACAAGYGIQVTSATYGRSATETACPTTNPDTDCFADVTTEMADLCDGLAECTVHNADSLSGVSDPCPATTGEILTIRYSCTTISLPDHASPSDALPSVTSISSGSRAYPDYEVNGGTRMNAYDGDPSLCGTECDGDGSCLAYSYNRVGGGCFHYFSGTECNTPTASISYYFVQKGAADCYSTDDSYLGAFYVQP